MVEFSIDKLCFSGGQEIQLEKDALIILIGANSAGKSRALNDITHRLCDKDQDNIDSKVILQIETQRIGNYQEWFDWMRTNFQEIINNGKSKWRTVDSETDLADLNYSINQGNFDRHIGKFLARSLNTESRLLLTSPVDRIDPTKDGVKNELQILLYDSQKLKLINKEVQSAFNKDLIPDYGAGTKFRVYTGHDKVRLEK